MTDTVENPYHVRLEIFEGPLDLLLHLIKENRLDINNIPIALVTEQYLAYIDMMKSLNLDVAGEFLLMAATLAHIKSRTLLPPDPTQEDPEEEGVDPRTELVRRLLEYQKYKDAADRLWIRPLLDRDVFVRERSIRPLPRSDEPAELVEISVFKLVEAFHRVLKEVVLDQPHNVSLEPVSIVDCAIEIIAIIRASQDGSIRFQDLFPGRQTRQRVITTFLALLDLIRRKSVRVFQAGAFSDIQLMGTPEVYGEWKYDGPDEYAGPPPQVDS
ncbi:MAG: segregation/condensation protein A [Pseudomonadota bacterium]